MCKGANRHFQQGEGLNIVEISRNFVDSSDIYTVLGSHFTRQQSAVLYFCPVVVI